MLSLVGLPLAALLLAGCGSNSAGGQGDATVSGRVMVGPTCPVEVADSPCPPRPANGALVQVLQNNTVVGSDTADDQGNFSIDAPAGTSVVKASWTTGLPSEDVLTVELRAGETTTITLTLDSGIR